MQEDGRSARAGHRRGNLLRDDAGLAYADKDDFAFGRGEKLDGKFDLIGLEARGSLCDCLGFEFEQINDLREMFLFGHAKMFRSIPCAQQEDWSIRRRCNGSQDLRISLTLLPSDDLPSCKPGRRRAGWSSALLLCFRACACGRAE